MIINILKKNSPLLVLPVSCVILGVMIGLSSGLLGLFLEATEHFFLGWIETNKNPVALNVLPIRRLISIGVGAMVVALIWYVLRNYYRRIPTVTKAVRGEKMPMIPTTIHVLAQIFFVGAGGSVGREVAPREAGALIAQIWQKILVKFKLAKITQEDTELLIAAAAGAGFAGVYLSPITGMFFAVEILLQKMTVRTVAVSLSMSAIAAVVGGWIKGTMPYYLVGNQKFSLIFLIVILIISPLSGVAGAYFRKGSAWAENHQTRNRAILWQLPIMGMITALISFVGIPEIMGNGRALAQTAIDSLGIRMIPFLLLVALLKAGVTIMTIRSGAAGGVLTPAISVGAALGAIIGILAHLIFPGIPIWQCAVLGATSLLAASQQAPLMALFMLIEIAHLPISSVIPLGVGVTLSVAFSQFFLKKKEQ